MRQLILTLFFLSFFYSFGQYSDTVFCDFGGAPNDIEYVIHYDQQQCPDSCSGSYSVEFLSSNLIVNSVIGPYGYSSTSIEDSSLCVGSYAMIVENTVTGGFCTGTFDVDTLLPFQYNLTPHNTSGPGICDGWAELNLSGGIPQYQITWYDQTQTVIPWETDTILDSLCAGTYYYLVDYLQPSCCDTCPATWGNGSGPTPIPFTIGENLIVNVDWTMDEICPYSCDGTAQVSAVGGSGNYSFELLGWGWTSSNGFFGGLCPGTYTVAVTDDLGSYGETTFDIFPAFEPIVTPSITHETCAGACDGTVVLNDQMGTIVLWSIDGGNNYPGSNYFDNMCPGVYDIYGMNYNGCELYITTITIAPGSSPQITNIGYSNPTSAGNDGCITQIDVMGGSPPYSYTIDGTPAWLPYCSLGAGPHIICVTDVNGCSTCETITLVNCSIMVSIVEDQPACAGSCNGVLSAYVTGASGNETYEWFDNFGNSLGGGNQITGLCSDSYSVTVTDVNGCTSDDTYALSEMTPVVATAQTSVDGCIYPCNNTITAMAAGGTGVYEYSLDNSSWTSNNVFTGVCPGVEIVYVQDQYGCQGMYTVLIDNNDGPLTVASDIVVGVTGPSCDGVITASGSGGVSPITYTWYNCENDTLVGNTQTIADLCPGIYYVVMTDANGCSVSDECDTIVGTLGQIDLSSQWMIYPNPANEVLNIKTGFVDGFNAVLMDATGKIVMNEQFEENTGVLKLGSHDLPLGVYIVELNSRNGQTIRDRVIIQR